MVNCDTGPLDAILIIHLESHKDMSELVGEVQ